MTKHRAEALLRLYVLEGGKSASKAAAELGIDKNTVCRWVREYRERHQMPTYEVERRIKKQSADELTARNKELEKELRKKERELTEEGISLYGVTRRFFFGAKACGHK